MLHVHRAGNARPLVEALADLLQRRPTGDPFAAEVVAVPARGIERWITQRLSHVLGAGASDGPGDGVCARVEFPRPQELLDAAVSAASPAHAAAVEAWDPDRVVWALLDVLDACPGDESWCRGLRHHLGLDRDEPSTRRYTVARRLAGLCDAYARSRPELLVRWGGSDDSGVPSDLAWQPELWRRLRAAVGSPAPAELLDDACRALRSEPAAVDLPTRLSVLGASRISTARLQVLAALAAHREVHLWLNHPSPALWDRLREAPVPSRRADLPLAARHPLLASLSRDVQELQLRLAAVAPGHADTLHARPAHRAGDGPAPGPAPVSTPPRTLLQRLQDDLRTDGGDREPAAPPLTLDPTDRSVQVHACHGRARQVEVLREVVLGLLADDPTLEPRDVIVMCPDVETYAPLVAAVFATDSHPGGRLRVRIADRSPRRTNPLLGVAAQLLELAAGRVSAPQVLDLAGAPPVRRRFRFDDDALEQVRAWTVASGVRWGLDGDFRARWQLAGLDQGTWRAGLDRVLAGVAMEEGGVLLGDTLPLDDVESSDVELAGHLAELLDRLGDALARLRGPQPAPAWVAALQEATLSLSAVTTEDAWQVAQLARELGEVGDAAEGAAADLTLADVTALLEVRLSGRPTTTSFRTGAMTVCTLTPMRSVPHRVVCLLGLDDGAFPRHGPSDGDDLLARDPRLGERDPRAEDRQLFLEAITSAEEHLVVTYSGADVRTGAALAPAVPVGELLDALDATASTAAGGPARDQVVVHHPLQPFDARNFRADVLGRPGPFSFDRSALAGGRSATAPRQPLPPFLGVALPPGPAEPDVDLGRLGEFLVHPAKGLLRQRLGVQAGSRDEEPDDAMPIELDALQTWSVGDRLLQARVAGTEPARLRALERARGELPPPPLADGVLQAVGTTVERIVEASAPYRALPAATVDVTVPLPSGRRLLGSVRGVRGDVVLTVTYSTVRAKQQLRAWVELLALSAARGDGSGDAPRAVLVGRAPGRDPVAVLTLGPVPPGRAAELLAELVEVRDVGLRTALPLPVGAGEGYATSRHDFGKPPTVARWQAEKAWTTKGPGWPKEDADPEHELVWGGRLPFEDLWSHELPCPEPGRGFGSEPTAFARLARRVWDPLLEVRTVNASAGGGRR